MYASWAWASIRTCIPFIPALGVRLVITTGISIDIFACGARMRLLPLSLLYILQCSGGIEPTPTLVGNKNPSPRLLSARCPHATPVHGTEFIFVGHLSRWSWQMAYRGDWQPRLCTAQVRLSHPFRPVWSTRPEQVHLGEPPLHWEFLDIKVKVSLIYLFIYSIYRALADLLLRLVMLNWYVLMLLMPPSRRRNWTCAFNWN